MAKRTRRRWACPNGEHQGILAPLNLGPLDVRRFCLECSWELSKGDLVERVCIAKVAKKKKAKAKAAVKRSERKIQKKVEKAAEYVVGGVRIDVEFRRLCRLSVWVKGGVHPFKGTRGARKTLPGLSVVDDQWPTSSVKGGINQGVTLRVGSQADVPEVESVLLGWLAKQTLVQRSRYSHIPETDEHVALLAKAAKAAYKIDPVPVDAMADGNAAQNEIARQLRERGV